MTNDDENELASTKAEDSVALLDTDEEPAQGTVGEIDNEDDLHQNLDNKWNDAFARLLLYIEKHGDALVPNRYQGDPHLGSWVSTQRRQHRQLLEGKGTPMTQARARKLEEVGFQWTTRDPRHVPWSKRYEELQEFKQRFGHAQVPIGWKENVPLSNWISTQRQEYKLKLKGRNSRLTQERIDLLNKVDFVWEAQRGGPRRQERATVSVPAQAHPAQARNKTPKVDYAQMMTGAQQFMMPGGFSMMPFAMPPGMMMPAMPHPAQANEATKDKKDGEEMATDGKEEGDTKVDDASASASKYPYYNPHMMMNPQMMAAMGWPMMPPGTSSSSQPMAIGFFPMAAPYMMGWPQATPAATTTPSGNVGTIETKRKAEVEIDTEAAKKAKTEDAGVKDNKEENLIEAPAVSENLDQEATV
ncbi:hypothetical protein MPSEU_000801400 [Mayamaea pseudoterrestris]|nr:hypothetical protein MPSEU_000801400 [Mayamaea pseudoterrestris]